MNSLRRTRVLLLLLALLAAGTASAQSDATFSFLRMDMGGRAAALGGSPVALAGDPEAVFVNPAGAATLSSPTASLGFFKHLLDINAGFVSGAYPLEEIGTLTAGVMYVNYGSFDEKDELGTTLGSFSASDLAVSLGYANTAAEGLSYGGAVKFITSSIASYGSSALAADAGIHYAVPESRVTLGASIRNLGAQLDAFDETGEDLPLDLAVGGSVIPKGIPLQLSLTFSRLTENVDSFLDRFSTFAVGAEFTLSTVLQLRFGYNNSQRKDWKLGTSSGLAGFSGGLGVTVQEYRLDYAFTSLGRTGGLHRITLRTSL
jgi:hypothetical protein